MLEVWKNINGYDGIYQVSSLGRIKSKYSKDGKSICKEYHLLKPLKMKNGYLKVMIGRKNKTIHRLVAETFIDNPKGLTQVNHKNGNKKDNSVSNLEWVNSQQNMEHAVRNGLKKSRGIRMYNLQTGEIVDFTFRKDIEKYLNRKICQDLITRCCNKERYTAYGMVWRYIQAK